MLTSSNFTSGKDFMKIATLIKTTFIVIGREGSTENGAGFVQRLWARRQWTF